MISDAIEHELKNRNLLLTDFKRVVLRLLDKQVIYRQESNTEAEIYDLYIRMETLINEYLHVIGISVINHTELSYVIAYPPGSDIPGVHTDDTGENALQRYIRIDEAGLLITLRLLYEEKIREGEIDENGCVYVPLETVFTRYHSIVKREMPASESERKTLFNALRKLRIIEYGGLINPDHWLGIREVILHFTLEGVLQALNDDGLKDVNLLEIQDEEE